MATRKSILLAHKAGYVPSNWDAWSRLVRCATKAARLAEQRCNGSPIRDQVRYGMPAETMKRLDVMADKQEAAWELEDQRNDDRMRALAAHLGLEIDLGGDPRGAVVKVRSASITKPSSLCGEGWFFVA